MEYRESDHHPHHRIELEGFPEVDLRKLEPRELAMLWEALSDEDDEYYRSGSPPRDEETDEHYRLYRSLGEVVPKIPDRDPEYGLHLASELAVRPNSVIRWNAILMLPSLTRHNHDAGVDLWQDLIRDEDPENREAALELARLSDVPRELHPRGGGGYLWNERESLFNEHEYEAASEIFAEQGLTVDDARHLHEVFLAASRDEIEKYDPLAESIKRLKGEA
jgi:hypothetical protein